jgi:hypothetical protein
MFRTIALSAAIAVLAGSASAADIRVKIDGKNDMAVQQEIRVAAHKVCASYTDSLRGLERSAACFKYTVADAQAQVVQERAFAASKTTVVASK